MFDAVRADPAMNPRVSVNIHTAIPPSAFPTNIVDENSVFAPTDAARTPAPRTKPCAKRNAKAKRYGTANKEARTRWREYDERIVGRHDNEVRIHWLNGDVWTTRNHNVLVGTQVAIFHGLPAHALDGVHNFSTLLKNRVTKIGRPGHIRSHHVEDRRKWEQRQDARVPREVVRLDGLSEFRTGEVMMFVSPLGSLGNLVGERCS